MKNTRIRKQVIEQLNPYCGFYYTIKKVLYHGQTKYQVIDLVDTAEFGKVLLLDGVTQVAEKNHYQYHELMVHPALATHPDPRNVLIIGGGDGGILREVNRYRAVKSVTLAEIDEEVIAFSRRYLASVHGRAFNDPRVHTVITDGRLYVEEHAGEFDAVIMDMTDPSGPSMMLYTKEFYRLVKRSFRSPDSLFVLHSESPQTRPDAFNCIQKTLASVFRHVTTFYQYVQMYGTLWAFTICSDRSDLDAIPAPMIDQALKEDNITGLKVYSGRTHEAMWITYPWIDDILRKPARIITDKNPEFPDSFIRS